MQFRFYSEANSWYQVTACCGCGAQLQPCDDKEVVAYPRCARHCCCQANHCSNWVVLEEVVQVWLWRGYK
jgi:hypothetical protein